MRMLRSCCLVLLLAAFCVGAAAQSPGGRPIEQQMSPEEFKAAGLGKLSAEELARLNAWLNRTIDTETTKAAAQAQDKVRAETRGFFNFGSDEPIVSSIVGEFRGFEKHRSYTLANGHVWKQIDSASLVGVRKTDPKVRITPSLVGNSWYLAIEGYNTRAQVIRTK
jgi:hypothetical protein